jgi:hypothetical protein
MPGVPVDLSGILRLCELTGNEGAKLVVLEGDSFDRHSFAPGIRVTPVSPIITCDEGQEYVCGLVVKNPFFGKAVPFRVGGTESALSFLSSSKILVCDLPQWHLAHSLMDHYRIQNVEARWIENVPALYVSCDWDE